MKSKTQNTSTTTVREVIRARRGELGLSQSALGKLLGLSDEFVCYLEGGQRKLHLDKVPALADALKYDRKELCRMALQEHFPKLFSELFDAPSVEPGVLAEYLDWAAKFHAVSDITIDPGARPDDFEIVE
jgi:transcriptional regulator with XRE-family HTH domain